MNQRHFSNEPQYQQAREQQALQDARAARHHQQKAHASLQQPEAQRLHSSRDYPHHSKQLKRGENAQQLLPHQQALRHQHPNSFHNTQNAREVLTHVNNALSRASYAHAEAQKQNLSEDQENQNLTNLQFEKLHAQAAKQAAVSYQVQQAATNLDRRYSHGMPSRGGEDAKLQNFGMQQRLRSKDERKDSQTEAYGRTASTGKHGSHGSSSGGRAASGGSAFAQVSSWVHPEGNQDPRAAPAPPMTAGQQKQQRADSGGPAPHAGNLSQGRGLHSSGGSIGAHSYRTTSNKGNMVRSHTQGRIMSSQVKRSKLTQIRCPCAGTAYTTATGVIRGRKQPMLMSSECTANCGHCGQFFAVKESKVGPGNQSGSQLEIVKAVRAKSATFKLDQPMGEIFARMRAVSEQYLSALQPNSFYLTKREKRIDNLSFIADTLQSDSQTIHHAVHLMDLYSSKVPKNEQYDTLLISLCCLLISSKYLQIKYPGADALNHQVSNRYTADQIIATEGIVVETIDWQLMNFPLYDYVRLFISQGCLFEHERLLPQTTTPPPKDFKDRPTPETAEVFKRNALLFADLCLYQQCFMRSDPYNLAAAVVAYTRKYMGVAVVWTQEMELLTRRPFPAIRDFFGQIEAKYRETLPDQAGNQPQYADQELVEPQPSISPYNPQTIRRGHVANQLLLSDDKTATKKLSQNSSNVKQASHANITHLFGELKTPDKMTFDFNSVVSENKNAIKVQPPQFVASQEKTLGSSSFEKQNISIKKKKDPAHVSKQMVFSDNKRQSINAHEFKKQILRSQINTTLSDEKKVESELRQENFLQYQREQYKRVAQLQAKSQHGDATVTSPSANIGDAEAEQEVPPAKPMIIKSNSQAINQGYENNTTTKKSPKGLELERICALKESMRNVAITAKMPSSTTNQSARENIGLKISHSFHNGKQQPSLFGNRKSTGAFTTHMGFGVRQGPIKINQKITNIVVTSSQKKKKAVARTAAANTHTHTSSSSNKKLKVSKSYIAGNQLQSNSQLRENLSKNFQKVEKKSHASRQARGTSATSVGQQRPTYKHQSFVSGKATNPNLGAHVYNNRDKQSTAGDTSSQGHSVGGRSVLSMRNAADAIKRKRSYHGPGCDLRVNINKGYQQQNAGDSANVPSGIPQVSKGKNVPNGLLRRATGGTQGRQDSIGPISMYQPRSNGNRRSMNESDERADMDSHGSLGRSTGLLRNQSIEDMRTNGSQIVHSTGNNSIFRHNKNSAGSKGSSAVNPPAIINPTTSVQHQKMAGNQVDANVAPFSVHAGQLASQSSLNSTKATLSKLAANQRITTERANSRDAVNHAASGLVPTDDEPNKPIQKMIKSGSQVLGKARPRVNMSRREMMKQLNDQKEQMSAMFEAAHATHTTSNEKSSNKKQLALQMHDADMANPQVYTQKYQGGQRFELPIHVSQFDLPSHSEERPKKAPKNKGTRTSRAAEDTQVSAQVSLANLKAIEPDVMEMQQLQRDSMIDKKKFRSSYDVTRSGMSFQEQENLHQAYQAQLAAQRANMHKKQMRK